MSATVVSPADNAAADDRDLVAGVRAGDDAAFEELYRRYRPRIAAFVRRMVRDEARTEDVTQEAFLSALRRMRATDCDIAFKPWIYEIARNASIDVHRRTSRAHEVSIDQDGGLCPSDRCRLEGPAGPDAALIAKERLDHLRGAFDELSDVHSQVLVMRELEGLSYREIAERLDLSRSSVESALFRARRRLEHEYAELSEGRRCEAARYAMVRLADGAGSADDERRLGRHARRCVACRRAARELGVEPIGRIRTLANRAAALLPLPWIARRGAAAGSGDGVHGLFTSSNVGAAVAERAAALVAAVAIAGAGGAALSGDGAERPESRGDAPAQKPAADRPAAGDRGGAAAPGGQAAPAAPRDGARERGERGRQDAGGRSGAATGSPDAGAKSREGVGGAERDGSAPVQGGASLPSLPSVPDVGAPDTPGGDVGGRLPKVELPAVDPPPIQPPQLEVPQSLPLPEVEVPQLPQVDVGIGGEGVQLGIGGG
jgi:RNA polymerase sigma factor (sigma-70 family)